MIRRCTFVLACLSLLGLAVSSPVGAATASLVRDIQPSAPSSPFDSGVGVYGPLQSIGDRVLFGAFEYTANLELWTSDGRTEGTSMVRDICPGNGCGGAPQFLGRAGRVGIFLAQSDEDNFRPTELWRSDGTAEGTFRLSDLRELERCSGFTATVGGNLFFALSRYETGCELWKSDGTVTGTGMVEDLAPGVGGSSPSHFAALGGKLYFLADGPQGTGLWRTDGTAAGTILVHTLVPGDTYRPNVVVAGSRLFFLAPDDGNDSLWTSDGTAAGTRRIRELPGAGIELTALDGLVYFIGLGERGGTELWRSDGTEAGTRQVTDFEYDNPFPSAGDSLLPLIAHAGNRLIFIATNSGANPHLWVSSGTPETTRPLEGCANRCPGLAGYRLTSIGNRVVFWGSTGERGVELWSTDGTPAGTRLLRDICRGSCSSGPSDLVPALGKWFFTARDQGGFGLWSTDGTEAGTRLIAPLGPNPFDFDEAFSPVEAGGKIFFVAAVGGRKSQLWESNGTPAGTRPVTVIGSANPSTYPESLTAFGDTLLFTACDGEDRAIWRSNGTEEGTVPLEVAALPCGASDPPRSFRVVGGLAFFLRGDAGKLRLWRTDGTDAGTFPLPPFGSVGVASPVVFGGRLVFQVFEEDGSSTLWESDGTVAGTHELVELPSGTRDLTPAGPDLYFIANTGVSTADEQLWRTDGTAAGTREVTRFESSYPFEGSLDLVRLSPDKTLFIARSGTYGANVMVTGGTWESTYALHANNGHQIAGASNLVVFGGAAYFCGTTANGAGGTGFWRTDGTSPGTVLLSPARARFDFQPLPAEYTPIGNLLYFMAEDDEHGAELWRTDGTPAGTVLVRDIAPGAVSSNPSNFVAAGGKLYFTAYEGVHGYELWQSDGTTAGTRMVQDIAPGPGSSRPEELTVAGSRLFFRADDGLHGQELWALPVAGGPACEASSETLCLGGGRFRVEATWRDFQGNSGVGQAVSLTPDTGYFWFFNSANVEVILKVLDGLGVNGHHWAFYGALSNVEYTLTITDTQTGAVRRYVNPPGRLGSVGDTSAFGPKGATGSGLSFGPEAVTYKAIVSESRTAAAAAPCVPSATRLCLNNGRFAVEAKWRDFQGNTGTGKAVPLSGGDTGYFWFFNEANVEVVLKVLDGRGVNGKYWVFYGALSSVEYELTVTDTQTGAVKVYKNPSGRLASVADTDAF